MVEFAPAGGGFVRKMPSDKFHEHHSLETQEPGIVSAYFGGDWSNRVFPGYNKEGVRWNGWGVPLFTKATAQAVASDIQELQYNPQNDSFDITTEGELEQFKGVDVDVPGLGLLRLYAVGAGCWCWDHYESLDEVGEKLSVVEVIDVAIQSSGV